jgi:hypothetical protein
MLVSRLARLLVACVLAIVGGLREVVVVLLLLRPGFASGGVSFVDVLLKWR